MISSGYLVPPSRSSAKQPLWDETWKRVDRFLPDLRNDLASESSENSQRTESSRTENNGNGIAGETGDLTAIVAVGGRENKSKD